SLSLLSRQQYVARRALHSFPTRRSSDLTASSVNDFVWKGMNIFYLYKDNVPSLANDAFNSDEAYANYLNGFSNPRDLFESVIHQDRKSTRLNSSHVKISYAVFCLKKKRI